MEIQGPGTDGRDPLVAGFFISEQVLEPLHSDCVQLLEGGDSHRSISGDGDYPIGPWHLHAQVPIVVCAMNL